MKRRNFISLALTSSLLAACDFIDRRKPIGLALGGGGARGLAHVPVLELLDELNLKPDYIAGTSIGAVIGVMYAAGMTGRQIRGLIERLTVSSDESWLQSLFEKNSTRWWNLIDIELGRGGLIDTSPFIEFLLQTIQVSRFDRLEIPLKVVATDFWERQQVVLQNGELGPAIQASIAIPGLFSPVQYAGKILVDGGLANPVPYDLLFGECETIIAVDVLGKRSPTSEDNPDYFETLFNTMQIMQAGIMQEKLARRPPQVYIRPELVDILVLDFNRVDEIYAQTTPALTELKRTLGDRFGL